METITISSEDFLSYASVAEADVYFIPVTTEAATAFKALDEAGKGSALVQATRMLDSLRWRSDYDTQAKREDVVQIVNACMELAAALSEDAETGQTNDAEIKRLKAGPVEIENFRSDARAGSNSLFRQLPFFIRQMLVPYVGGSTVVSGSYSYGTSGESPADVFDRDLS